MPWGIAAAAVVGAYSANQQSKAAKKAAKAGAAGQMASVEEYKQYNQPYYDAGTSALSRLEKLNAGDMSAFQQSPDYQWTQQQGLEGINRMAASRGALNSGGTDVDLLRYGQGLASQQYGNYYSRLAQLAGMGQSSAQGLGGSASNAAANIGALNAQGIVGSQNAWSNYGSQLGSLLGQYQGQHGFGNNRQSTYTKPSGYSGPSNTTSYGISIPTYGSY